MNSEHRDLLLKEGLVLGHQIGKGSFGTVYQCTDIKTQVSYAIKLVDLRMLRMQPHFVFDRLKRECSVLEKLTHPSIVKLYKTIEAQDAMLMVMEMVLGMELFELIVAVNGMDETDAAAVFIQIASALMYMHAKGIIHRDVKPENILLQGSTVPVEPSLKQDAFTKLHPRVKLVDFGLSKDIGGFHSNHVSAAKSLVGTPRYVAPEIVEIGERLRQKRAGKPVSTEETSYSSKVDCYSVGVLLHVMVAACFPQFDDNGDVVFSDPRIAKVSDGVKDLIKSLMKNNPDYRMDMREALEHPWTVSHYPFAAKQARNLSFFGPGKAPAKLMDISSSRFISDSIDHDSMYVPRDEYMDAMETSANLKRLPTTPTADMSRGESLERSQTSSVEEIILPGAQDGGVWGPYTANRSRTASSQSMLTAAGGTMETQNKLTVMGDTNNNSAIAPYNKGTLPFSQQDLQLLVNLQQQIASCFRAAFDAFRNDDVVAPGIEASAIGSRELLRASDNLLNKLGNTSISVLELLPDIEVGVEEGEIGMAKDCFASIKTWIKELQSESQDLMKANVKVIASVNHTLQTARRKYTRNSPDKTLRDSGYPPKALRDHLDSGMQGNLFGNAPKLNLGRQSSIPTSGTGQGAVEAAEAGARASYDALEKENLEAERMSSIDSETSSFSDSDSRMFAQIKQAMEQGKLLDEKQAAYVLAFLKPNSRHDVDNASSSRVNEAFTEPMEISEIGPICEALNKLVQIDSLLQRNAEFWSKMELVVDVLMQRANHVKSMVNYTQNPRLRGRFLQRVKEYESLWKGLVSLSNEHYKSKTTDSPGNMYRFLTI